MLILSLISPKPVAAKKSGGCNGRLIKRKKVTLQPRQPVRAAKFVTEKKTEENARVRTLVENARKWDPRVIKHKAETAAAAAAAKAEKERLIAEEKQALIQATKAAAEQKVRTGLFVKLLLLFCSIV